MLSILDHAVSFHTVCFCRLHRLFCGLRVHETARIYDADIEGLRMEYDKLVDTADVILSKLAAIK